MTSNFQSQKTRHSSRTQNSPLRLPRNPIYLIQWISLIPLHLTVHITQVTRQFNQSLERVYSLLFLSQTWQLCESLGNVSEKYPQMLCICYFLNLKKKKKKSLFKCSAIFFSIVLYFYLFRISCYTLNFNSKSYTDGHHAFKINRVYLSPSHMHVFN